MEDLGPPEGQGPSLAHLCTCQDLIQCMEYSRCSVKNSTYRRKWQPTPVFLPRESTGQRSLGDYSPYGHKEPHTTEATESAVRTGRTKAWFLCIRASLVAQLVKNPPAMQETWVRSLGWEAPLEKGKATHSCVLAWRIPGTGWSMESQRVGHD